MPFFVSLEVPVGSILLVSCRGQRVSVACGMLLLPIPDQKGATMVFRAVHEQWGTVFAHLLDLGCGRVWEDVWRVRPVAPLVCDECRHPLRAKVSPAGLRFFAHAPGAPECAAAGESMAHHLLKLELASAAHAAGAHTEMEVRGPGGAWRADVMASGPDGAWRMALEAQLSPITAVDIVARTERMLADDVTSVWFSDRPRPPWLGVVPSVRLVVGDDGGLVVAEGLAKFVEGWWKPGPQVPLTKFLQWVFTCRIGPHDRQRPTLYPLEPRGVVWTAPQYIREEVEYLVKVEQQERARQEAERARQRHQDAINALLDRQAGLTKPAVAFVYQETGSYPLVTEEGTPEFAMGLPVHVKGVPYAVICPVAGRVAPLRDQLAPLVLLVASERERERIAAQACPEQRIVVLQPDPAAARTVPQQERPDAVTVRHAVTRMFGLDRM